jgi:alanine dehydrogenase
VSIRERNRAKYDLPTVFSILIYTRDRLPARHQRLQLSYGDAHRRRRRRLSEMDGAQELEATRCRRRRPYGRGTPATCNVIFPWEQVRVWSRTRPTLDHFVAMQQPKYQQLKLRASTNIEEVVEGADIVVTVTPTRGTAVMNDWIAPGTHIVIGADTGVTRSSIPRSCSMPASSSTISASVEPAEKSTCRCARG